MTALVPIFANERSAAKLVDMKPAEFLRLVSGGHLPKPRNIGGMKRWDVDELRRIIRGEAVDSISEVSW